MVSEKASDVIFYRILIDFSLPASSSGVCCQLQLQDREQTLHFAHLDISGLWLAARNKQN